MFGKIKKALGIEGVKVEMIIPESISPKSDKVTGKLKFTSLSDQIVGSVEVKMIEKYARGRKDSRLIDEYVIGEITLTEPIEVKPNQIVEVDFDLPFTVSKSEMDKMGESNIFSNGIVKFAKYLKKVSSEYRIEAIADVQGTKFDPSVKKVIVLK